MNRLALTGVLLSGMYGAAVGATTPAQAQATVQSAASRTTTIVEPPAPLLPTSDRLMANDTAANVPPDSPELSAILKESGLKRTETRAVIVPTVGAPAASGWIRAYQFVDATGAFSAYTYLRRGGKTRHDPGTAATETELPNGETLLLSGVSLIRANVRQYPESLDTLLTGIQVGLPKVGGAKGIAPKLPSLLPTAGLQPETLRYALGPTSYAAMGGVLPADILGWNKSAEAATASYSGRKGTGTLTLLLYPTPEIAGDRGRAIEQAINQRGPASFGTVKLRRIGTMVGMTSGSFTPAQAEALLGSVHVNQEVTFDKAMPTEFHAEIKKTATLLQSIAIFTGVGILAALVMGVFFGGARAGIRVLQGKPAWTDPEFLRIDLRGRPLPLHSSRAEDAPLK